MTALPADLPVIVHSVTPGAPTRPVSAGGLYLPLDSVMADLFPLIEVAQE